MSTTTPYDMVNVRVVVRDIDRYERVVRMPRSLFESNREQLAQAAHSPLLASEIASSMFDCFVDGYGDDLSELTEVEAFELAAPDDAHSMLVDPSPEPEPDQAAGEG